jgi:hypothetical protein
MEDVKLTERRKQNLRESFKKIIWNFETAELHDYGWGDRVSFKVPGTYKSLSVVYYHRSPGGSNARMKVWNAKGEFIRSINPAPQLEADRIQQILELIDKRNK